jgi:hypothetical protein
MTSQTTSATCSGCGYTWELPGHATVHASSICSVCADSRERAIDLLALLEMTEGAIEHVLNAARAQGEVMTVLEDGNIRVEYRAGIYTVTP